MSASRVEFKELNRIPEVVERLQALESYVGEAGVFADWDPFTAKIAALQEYGYEITVTDRMRRYLASQGLLLRKETTHLHVPSRPFFRTGVDRYEKSGLERKVLQEALSRYLEGHGGPEDLYDLLAFRLAQSIRRALETLQGPPLHPFTVSQKGHATLLYETGRLARSIQSRVAPRGGE